MAEFFSTAALNILASIWDARFLAPGGVLTATLAALAIWRKSSPTSSTWKELRRRLAVHARGRTTTGVIIDILEGSVFYSYEVEGAHYEASQDLTAFPWLLGRLDVQAPVLVKYLPSNPANSIVHCEQWSGLRCLSQLRR